MSALDAAGISAKQAARYVESGWLLRLSRGVYAFPGDELAPHAMVKLLQQCAAGLHVAGRSALALQGVKHNLSTRNAMVLWGDVRFALPGWFTSRQPARYVNARLFDWPDHHLADSTLMTPPGVTPGLCVSAPERAILEMLYDVGTNQGLEEARNIFEGLRNVRRETMGRLLGCCRNVKAVRLFLTWARETSLLDIDQLLHEFPVRAGSPAQRWVTRLPDGTLLSLKPHG